MSDALHPRSTESEVRPGHLYVVATPIGNLGDLSPRACAILGQVDRICAEDTRTSGRLLAQFGIDRPLTAVHEHNESAVVGALLEQLQRGAALALISDAGTPLVSDPGYVLVRAARRAGIPVIAVAGPCAAIAALSVSGIASDSFSFFGFLPHKAGARRQRLQQLASEPRTLILYESSHRIVEAMSDICSQLGPERELCLCRELSKRFEESHSGSAAEVLSWLKADDNHQRGEFVLVIAGAAEDVAAQHDADRLLKVLLTELSPARAARVAAELGSGRKQALYRRALELSGAEHPADDDEAPC